ncbi:MAG: DUF1311 domain-containing protein [Bacteroidales bacterium]|nr:DUF1311 domain-containing protein [Bacteroidales bacterium]
MKNKKVFIYTLVVFVLLSVNVFCQNGIDYYYGLNVEKNYQKALAAFLEDNNSSSIPFIIIMYLNGDGVTVNPNEALKVWKKATESGKYVDITMEGLKRTIDERLANPDKRYPRIEYCEIAMTTIDMNICQDINNSLKDQEIQIKISKISTELNANQKSIFNLIEGNYSKIEKNDADRMYNLYIEGTIRNDAYSGMESYIKERHKKRIEAFLIKKSIKEYSESDYLNADKNLNEVYKKQKLQNQNKYQEMIEMYKDDPEKIKYYQDLITEINLNLKNAQFAWIKYRDNWVILLKEIIGKENTEISVKTLLTLERIEELKYDSVGL